VANFDLGRQALIKDKSKAGQSRRCCQRNWRAAMHQRNRWGLA